MCIGEHVNVNPLISFKPLFVANQLTLLFRKALIVKHCFVKIITVKLNKLWKSMHINVFNDIFKALLFKNEHYKMIGKSKGWLPFLVNDTHLQYACKCILNFSLNKSCLES
jgi:hypothetical protein